MAKLTPIEMQKFETLLDMSGGYVLNFTNQDFARFINRIVKIDIESGKYDFYGTSKAKRLKRLWEIEGDITVGKLLENLVDYYQAQIDLEKPNIKKVSDKIITDCKNTALILQGKESKQNSVLSEKGFLSKDIDETAIETLSLPQTVVFILEQRISELKKCLKVGAPLSVIFLSGSILEGILLNVATKYPAQFNKAVSAPKDKLGKVKQLQDWSLNSLIDVANEIEFIGLDVKKHSHSLREFRNFIHPFEQMSSGFNPDNHTAEIAWKVLKAAMYDLQKSINNK